MDDIWLASAQYLQERIAAQELLPTQTTVALADIQALISISEPLSLKREGSTAILTINGAMVSELTPIDALLHMFFGRPLPIAYNTIGAALLSAQNDDEIKQIKLNIKSQGGQVEGFLGLINTIQSMNKPIVTHVSDYALSAGYFLASQTSKIVAENALVEVGSVGVMVAVRTDNDQKTFVMRSGNAPLKNLSITEEKAQAELQQRLNIIEQELMTLTANGRGKSLEHVQQKFGQGGILQAADALAVGMIDEIATVKTVESADTKKQEDKENKMDSKSKEELLASERKRVSELMSVLERLPKTEAASKLVMSAIENGKAKADIMDDALELMAVAQARSEDAETGVQNPPTLDPVVGSEFATQSAMAAEEKEYEAFLERAAKGEVQ